MRKGSRQERQVAGEVIHRADSGHNPKGLKVYEGRIARIMFDRGFGFIAVVNQPDVFFHVHDLIDLPFDETLIERRVRFGIVTGPKGPKAAAIQAAE